MNTRMRTTLSAAVDAWQFVQRAWPFRSRTSPLVYSAIAGAGVAVGIGAGLLFAPQTGDELRATLVEWSRGWIDSVGTNVQAAAKSAEEGAEELEADAQAAVTSAERTVESSARHASGSKGGNGGRGAHGRRHSKHPRA